MPSRETMKQIEDEVSAVILDAHKKGQSLFNIRAIFEYNAAAYEREINADFHTRHSKYARFDPVVIRAAIRADIYTLRCYRFALEFLGG